MNTRAVGKHSSAARVYIGRPSKWGSPFVIGREGSRADVIAKYRACTIAKPAQIEPLKNCEATISFADAHPACHGDVSADLADRR